MGGAARRRRTERRKKNGGERTVMLVKAWMTLGGGNRNGDGWRGKVAREGAKEKSGDRKDRGGKTVNLIEN